MGEGVEGLIFRVLCFKWSIVNTCMARVLRSKENIEALCLFPFLSWFSSNQQEQETCKKIINRET